MERMVSALSPAVPTTPVATAEFVTNSLSTRLPEFMYDPDNGCAFEVWYIRYKDGLKGRCNLGRCSESSTNHIKT
ncbi:hypothetical protein RB195_007052 [Necator americanus]|uniref:DUF7083 domain-containing protein n=1 Tax=Necator americanus TaxID=51031 RepID=A0ABR1BVF5_NECAM